LEYRPDFIRLTQTLWVGLLRFYPVTHGAISPGLPGHCLHHPTFVVSPFRRLEHGIKVNQALPNTTSRRGCKTQP